MNIEGCLACDVVAGRVTPPGGLIYTGRYWLVSHQVSPALLPSFLIIKTRRHVEHLAELDSGESAEFGLVLHNVSQAMTQVLQPEKVYTMSFGEKVRHIHFYMIPRYDYLPASGVRTFLEVLRERNHICSDADAAAIAEKIREALKET